MYYNMLHCCQLFLLNGNIYKENQLSHPIRQDTEYDDIQLALQLCVKLGKCVQTSRQSDYLQRYHSTYCVTR